MAWISPAPYWEVLCVATSKMPIESHPWPVLSPEISPEDVWGSAGYQMPKLYQGQV